MPKQAPQQPAVTHEEPSGFVGRFFADWKAARQRGKGVRGFIAQQKEMAVSERQVVFFNEAKRAVKLAKAMKVAPTRVETFEQAVKRQGLTEDFLRQQMQRQKWVHLALYLVAGILLVYAFWLFMNRGGMLSLGTLVAAVAVAVNGYIHGFRAWQIENRNLIRLQDAIRIPSTYLVL